MTTPEGLAIRNITVSGRIASGTTTLAKGLQKALGWELLEGGALFEKIHTSLNTSETAVATRPDHYDLAYEEKIKRMLQEKDNIIIQSHLAGFDAQGIAGVYKIVTICEDHQGNDKTEIRIDRLVNRKHISVEEAKWEVRDREEGNLEKWRRLYANGNPRWVYWDQSLYDLVVNTYTHNQEESVQVVLEALGVS